MLRDIGTAAKYRAAARVLSTAAQAANARLFVLRNNGANLLVVTSLLLKAVQVAAGTAQENSLDVYKLTGFTTLDTTNTVTPVANSLKTDPNAANNAQLRALSPAAAGMTGGTSTKGSSPLAQLPYNVAAAINTTTQFETEVFRDISGGGEPLVLAQNEGLLVENRVLNVTSYGVAWFFDVTWAEVGAL